MPNRYTSVQLRVSENQKAKIRNALHSGAVSVSIRLKPEDFRSSTQWLQLKL